ncbi:hypothetical protein LPJ78_004633 [Coemansia sp. RSA 989]|nr:hypothetical protein BX667DRAFT_237491 [Coemansia mojavensis]KAJ1744059.1 hypothetical protein LPJ68_000444 [Coemansia sp. RSA 1086]KAJ1753532.1 hypothetical protein LPJ79_000392 [Coemansia sp. RSA 1821]KAJ1862559.1 hypothetical protein LPJ78_004633 [Coemansia sp. RSA 989]KAJ1870443.1 hypothetical protein LPJ55_004655 [Coemansia sp. RSA 990]KAJ2676682.1 hypothetical protein IWW42_000558 [Coemansia sp. RSA 1085]
MDTDFTISPADFAIDPQTANPVERQACSEFFSGKPNKTPERYIRIRNHMISEWQAVRPEYLTKIRARAGLRNCGDVNAIGRVHSFLERMRVINEGAVPKRRRAKKRVVRQADSSSESDAGARGDQGGRVIAHDVVERYADDQDYFCSTSGSDREYGHRKRRRRPARRLLNGNSEFRLIPCRTFDPEARPFSVHVDAGALALMDLHAHLMYTEIIGLLGGRFCPQTQRLIVEVAFPCNSTSTTTECEMDPASEVEARRVFSAAGRQVVGWFHSHPAFEATPSVRDIHNQHAYQSLCRRAADGVEPFVGLIVSPPGGSGPYGVSDIRVFYVTPPGPDDDHMGAEALPFSLPFTVTGQHAVAPDLLDSMAHLVESHADLAQRADLAKRFKRNEAMTSLEKLLVSMRHRWAEDVWQQWDDLVALRLRPLLLLHFCRGSASETGNSTPVAASRNATSTVPNE